MIKSHTPVSGWFSGHFSPPSHLHIAVYLIASTASSLDTFLYIAHAARQHRDLVYS